MHRLALWTRASSVVQYQNLDGVEDHLESFYFGEHEYKFGALAGSHDSVDILVLSSPKGAKTKLDLQFCEKVVPSFLVEDLMELLCININLLTKDMRKQLPPASLITSRTPQIPVALKQSPPLRSQRSSDRLLMLPKTSALHLRSKSIPSVPGLSQKYNPSGDLVMRVWTFVLSIDDWKTSLGEIDIHANFYDIWGNLIAAAKFAECYSQEGVEVTMEEIIEHPTMHMQTLLVSKRLSGKAKRQWYKAASSGNQKGRGHVATVPGPETARLPVRSRKFSGWKKNSGLRVRN